MKPSRETTESFVKNTKSNIHGWSPTRNKDSGKNRRPSGNQIIDNFTLTPIASDDTYQLVIIIIIIQTKYILCLLT